MKRALLLSILFSLCLLGHAQESTGGGSLQQAIRSFDSYGRRGQTEAAVENGIRATTLYYTNNKYHEAFEFLHRVEATISADQKSTAAQKAAMRYQVSKERMRMYTRLRKSNNALEQIDAMERHMKKSESDSLYNDFLYCKATCHYTFGQNAKGEKAFREMTERLTADGDYAKVDEVYKTLISNGRRSNNAGLLAQAYASYVAWKDSVGALKLADETGALNAELATKQEAIEKRDGQLRSRKAAIVSLSLFAVALIALLVVAGLALMRFLVANRLQKKTIAALEESNTLKARFVEKISAQLMPSLGRLDAKNPEVGALQHFVEHVELLARLESSDDEPVELQDTNIPTFCESLIQQVENAKGLTLTVNAPKMNARIHRAYVGHILSHLLANAASYAPEGGHVTLEFKKRGAHAQQFLVSNTGAPVAKEKQEDIFKPFLEVRDLTKGDGLGLPICRQIARRMGGDLHVDPTFVKGARFVLDLRG